MKTLQFNFKKTYIAIVLLLFWANSFSLAQKGDNTLTKQISNTYRVSPDDAFTLINKFGQVTINSWENNEIKVDVEIKAWARTEDEAQEILEKISIDNKRKDKEIFYETKFIKKHKNSNRSGFEINYEVNIPPYLSLNLDNRFGATYLGDYDGSISLTSAYGSLKTKRLSGKEVDIQVSYGKADIDEMRYGNLKTSYCSYVNIGKAGNIYVEDRNGRLDIEEADNIEANSAYSHFGIGKLNKSLLLEAKFGSAEIEDISPSAERLDIDIAYGSAELDLREVNNFNFDIEVSFGNFNSGANKLTYQTQIDKPTNKMYQGTKGKGGNPSIKIRAAYGNVEF